MTYVSSAVRQQCPSLVNYYLVVFRISFSEKRHACMEVACAHWESSPAGGGYLAELAHRLFVRDASLAAGETCSWGVEVNNRKTQDTSPASQHVQPNNRNWIQKGCRGFRLAHSKAAAAFHFLLVSRRRQRLQQPVQTQTKKRAERCAHTVDTRAGWTRRAGRVCVWGLA